jgi:hypothetical protein
MFKKLFIIWLIALTPILLFAKKEALIVAVGKYKNSKRVLHVGHDISKMEYLLEKQGFRVTILKDHQATYRNVVRHLKSYQQLSKNDVFVFYDTSHGVQIPDLNGDEADGQDEAFALYDATFDNVSIADVKGILVDDELELLLDRIHAKKLMIIDACHSGSFYKSSSFFIANSSDSYTTKALNCSKNFYNNRKKFFSKTHKTDIKNLVVLSASKDNQLSIDTPTKGGLFTDTIYHVWDKNPNITFKDLTHKSMQIIKEQKFNNIKPQQPQLHSSNNQENTDMSLYLQDVEGYLDMTVKKSRKNPIFIKSVRPHYRVNSSIFFDINTRHKKGYLYILNVGEKKIERIFPNRYFSSSQILSTKFRFPSKKFAIQADITNHKRQQRTVAYAILSDTPIIQLEQNEKLSFELLKKIFGNPNKKGWWSDMFSSKVSVAKSDFWVFR